METLKSIVKFPISIFMYICLYFYKLVSYFIKFIYFICFCVYKFFKYIVFALLWPLIIIAELFSNILYKFYKRRNEKIIDNINKNNEELEQMDTSFVQEPIDNTVASENYKNDKVKIRRGPGYYLNLFFESIVSVFSGIKKSWNNLSFIKKLNNEKLLKSNESLINFDSDKEKILTKKVTWEYVAINAKGKRVKGYIDAYSRVEVQSFLLGEELTPFTIRTNKTIQLLHGGVGKGARKFKNKDLIFFLAQLSTYLKSGITLVESLDILIRQTKNKKIKNTLREVTHELTMGESFSKALEKQGKAFPRLLINMIKASELTGELPETLDDMNEYYTEVEAARKEMISALTYPTIVFVFTLAVITFVMIYVVPQFVEIYNSMDSSEIPAFTKVVISASNFLQNNIIWIVLILIIVVSILLYLYKTVRVFRYIIQWVAMHIPIVKNIIIYNEVAMFAKTFSSLLTHNVFITDSMEILNKITNNEIYKLMILDTVSNLAKGDKISAAFKDQWAFPIPAYEMIVTGEKTGQLAEMMGKVSKYYQDLHKNSVKRVKSLVEPVLIVFLTFAVGVILLAIIIPMFNMYQQVQNMG